MRTWISWTVAVVAVLGAAYYWLLVQSHLPAGNYSIDLAEIRKLANSLPGEKPREVRVEQVATFTFPAAAIMAGSGWQTETAPAVSYQIVYPDRSVIVDTAMDEKITNEMGRATFHRESYVRMNAAMTAASLILITHEHPDHIGGIAGYPDPEALKKSVRLSREQAAHPERMDPARIAPGFQTIDYERSYAAAPGIVLIKAPGHSPGSQMVFVQRADGAEFLLIGDVAWQMRNIEHVRERPRLISDFMLHEDRDAVMLELAELHRLHGAEPNLHILPGHDGAPIAELEKRGLLLEGFQTAP